MVLPQGRYRFLHIRRSEHKGSGYQHIGPGFPAGFGRFPIDPAVHFDQVFRSRSRIICFSRRILSTLVGMNFCPPKPGFTLMIRIMSA